MHTQDAHAPVEGEAQMSDPQAAPAPAPAHTHIPTPTSAAAQTPVPSPIHAARTPIPTPVAAPSGSAWGWNVSAVWQRASAGIAQVATASASVTEQITRAQSQVHEQLSRAGSGVHGTAAYLIQTLGLKQDEQPSSQLVPANLDYIHVTDRLIVMPFPFDPRQPRQTQRGNPIDAISRHLNKAHTNHYMIWNVSEESYDYSKFEDQVLEYKFPGHPAPPLGLLFKIVTSIESWLEADKQNVALVHCLTGKGRTATIAACTLTWMGEFGSCVEALNYVAQRQHVTVAQLTIPSQRRYMQYFSNMMDGVKPSPEPLLLRRIILNGVPRFGRYNNGQGCRPYVQLFKAGQLVVTAPYQPEGQGVSENEVCWASVRDGCISFQVNTVIHGDVLLRCRHLEVLEDTAAAVNPTPNPIVRTKRVSMFRAAFHTGYVPSGVFRLTSCQLDGACADPRFQIQTDEGEAQDFFVDLIFAPVDKSAEGSAAPNPNPNPSGTDRPDKLQPSDRGLTLDPAAHSAFDALLHRDARFWEAVTAKKALNMTTKRSRRSGATLGHRNFSIVDGAETNDDGEVSFASHDETDKSKHSDVKVGEPDGITSDELLKQLTLTLAELELDRQDGQPGVVDPDAASSQKHENFLRPSNLNPNPVSSTTPLDVSANTELTALKRLEDELGISAATSTTTTASGLGSGLVSGEGSGATDLDELEAYLQSLQS